MFTNNSKKFTLTLVVSLVLILSLFPVSEANDFQRLPRTSHRNRLMKKRSPQKGSVLGPLVGAAPDPKVADTTSASSTFTSASSSLSSSSSSSSTTSASSTSISSVSSRSSAIASTSTSTSTSSSSSGSSSSSAPSSSSSSVASNKDTPDTSKQTQSSSDEVVVVTGSGGAIVTVTQTSTNPTPTDAERTQAGAASSSHNKAKSTALTVLIVIASSVGAVLLFWTIFRKWKLARSSKFDQRLQPIDWQPTSGDEGIIPANRRRNSNASSFRSGYGATSEVGHGSSDHGHRGGIPDHDFTAGPSHLAPVGGYADLARGPSPQPMQQLGRGPSLNRPNYDVGLPLHHQAPYGGRY